MATRSEAPGLARLLSAPRLTRYVRATGGDLLDALALYEWNTSMSGALFEALQGFEVIFRNAVHEQLSATHSAHGLTGQWYDDPRRVLDERARDDIAIARSRAGVGGRPPTPGHIIAELGLGFWRFLFARRYTHSLWVPSLRHAFPGLAGTSRDVHDAVEPIHKLRNRIAHHEPIYGRNHQGDLDAMVAIVEWIDPTTAEWLRRTSRVVEVARSKP